MKFLRFYFVMLALIVSGSMMAQSQKELSQLMRERGEYYFTLNVNDPHLIQAISEICSVDGTDGKTVVAYANQQEYNRLLKAGYQPTLQTPPSLREEAKMWEGGDRATYEWDSYPTYSQYESMMQSFPTSVVSGRTCTLMTLGTLSSGRKIMGVRINNGDTEGKPKFLYSSTIHGDETTGWILMLRLIDELCTSTDSRIVNLVNNLDIFIFPNTNPDGTYYGGNNTVTGARRANGNGVDMNRNYPDPHSSAHPDGNAYQTETQWFMTLAETYPFVMAANFHGGAEVVNYPWDNTSTRHADDAWWQYVSREYANLAQAVSSTYMTDQNNGITNGADWYTIGGGRQDYMNGYRQCREVTVECSTTKNPNASQLPTFWNYNHNAMLTYMEECLNGVHGKVIDANTNLALDGVTITVQNHDDQYSIVSTHEDGYFHRPIKGGSYTLAIAKDGYCPYFVDVTLNDSQSVNLGEIPLTPGSCLMPSFTASATNVSLGSSISFTDASYGDIVSWNWTFEGGTPSTSTAQNPTNIQYNTTGSFDVTLTISDSEGNSEILTKEDYINVTESYNMSNKTVTTCDALFYDSGGANGQYSNNLDYTMTFYPGTEGAAVCVTFTEFLTELNYDYLYVYNGTSTSASLIGQYSGGTSPNTVTATNNEGALTFRFTSDSGVTNTGWVATVSCVEKPEIPKHCYDLATSVSAGNYIMGFLNGNYLYMPTHNNNTTTVTTSSAKVTPTDYGFTEEEGATLPQYTLTAYGTNGQYYISYNGRYLARNSTSLTWTQNQTTSNGRWYINENGIYVTYNYNNYYLYYNNNNGSFALSTTAQNNITFYTEGNCPATEFTITATANPAEGGTLEGAGVYPEGETCTLTATAAEGYQFVNWTEDGEEVSTDLTYSFEVTAARDLVANFEESNPTEQLTFTLNQGWNWWSTYLNISLDDLEAALNGNSQSIVTQNGSLTYLEGLGWDGDFDALDLTKMYKIYVSTTCTVTLNGAIVNPDDYTVTLKPGTNWIGFPVSHAMTLNEAFSGLTPNTGDSVKTSSGTATYLGSSWSGSLKNLEPGKGYIYTSKANANKTFTFPSSK